MSETIAEIAAKVRPLLQLAETARLIEITSAAQVLAEAVIANEVEDRLLHHAREVLSKLTQPASDDEPLRAQLVQVRKERDEACAAFQAAIEDRDAAQLMHKQNAPALSAAQDIIAKARLILRSAGHDGFGQLSEMITRALKQAEQRGRSEMECEKELMAASAEFPEDWEGTVAERVRRLRREHAQLRSALEPFAGAGDDPAPYDLADRDDWRIAGRIYKETMP